MHIWPPTDPSRRRICGVSNCFASQTNTTSNPAQQNKQIVKCSSQTYTTSNPTQQNKQITKCSAQRNNKYIKKNAKKTNKYLCPVIATLNPLNNKHTIK